MQPTIEGCGIGEGPACCKFFTFGANGAECARFTIPELADMPMGSEFVPTRDDCQSERIERYAGA